MIVDTFSGPRGWSVGASMLGLSDIGVEWDRDACLTSVAAGFPVIRQDVSTLSLAHLRGNVEGFIGSPPCPTFSAAGRGAGRDLMPILLRVVDEFAMGIDDRETAYADAFFALLGSPTDVPTGTEGEKVLDRAERDAAMSLLIAEPMRLVTECEPEWIALEQVKEGLPVWKRIAHHLRGRGYHVWTDVVDAADYGVPQNRLRAVLLASRREFVPPQPTHAEHPHPSMFGPTLLPWVSMADALGWGTGDELQPPHASRPNDRTLPRRADRPAVAVAFGHDAASWRRVEPQFPADTIRVELHELAALQTFPVGYPFQGNKSSIARQIGDAVPCLLAAHLLAAVTGRSADLRESLEAA